MPIDAEKVAVEAMFARLHEIPRTDDDHAHTALEATAEFGADVPLLERMGRAGLSGRGPRRPCVRARPRQITPGGEPVGQSLLDGLWVTLPDARITQIAAPRGARSAWDRDQLHRARFLRV